MIELNTKPASWETAENLIRDARDSGQTYLDLANLSLEELPPSIWDLDRLVLLELQGNKLTRIPDEIRQLHQLQLLELSNNELTSIPNAIFELPELQSLFLRNNILSKLPDVKSGLSKLIKLDVSRNQLEELPAAICDSAGLSFLDCSFNHLANLPRDFGKLSRLTQFVAAHNQLISFPPGIEGLKMLQALDLSYNQLRIIPDELATLNQLETLSLVGNPKLGIPSELLRIRAQDGIRRSPVDLVKAYHKTRGESGAQLRELKLLVVGRGGAGKTSLVKRLKGEGFDQHEGETHGITIRNLDLNCSDGPMTTRIWDFGGQVILHAMHEFFLTARSMYLLVLTEREDLAQRDAKYWLQLIRVYAPDAPVVIALNKSANRSEWDIDLNHLSRHFGPIVGWVHTDCETSLGIKELNDLIVSAANSMQGPRELFPKQWFSIKDEILAMSRPFMDFTDFQALCREKGETNTENQLELSAWLHDLGIALNYGRDPRLRDTTVLRPDWLANGIYAILRSNDLSKRLGSVLADNSIITKDIVGKIYKAAATIGMVDLAEYPEDKWRYVMKLMGMFQLAFPLDPESAHLLVPSLLSSIEPSSIEAALRSPIRWRYAMNVVPAALMPRFIVKTFSLSENGQRWRRGCTLEFGRASAVVRVDADENVIDVGISISIETTEDDKREPVEAADIHFDAAGVIVGRPEAAETHDAEDLRRMIRGSFEEVFQDYRGIHVTCQVLVEDNWVPEVFARKLARSNPSPF